MKAKYKRILLAASSCLLSVEVEALTFDTSLLAGRTQASDLSHFYLNNDLPAGRHLSDVYVNNHWKGRYHLLVGQQHNDIQISYQDAIRLGISTQALNITSALHEMLPLTQLVQGGTFDMDVSTLSLRLKVPQAFIIHSEAGYVDPAFWDQGIPAFMLGYNTTYYHSEAQGHDKSTIDEAYTGLETGINLAGWQFRDSSHLRYSSRLGSRLHNNSRYLQRSFAAIKSSMTAGWFTSPGDLFDPLRMRGAMIASDLSMRPGFQQYFSPVVQGVAQTNALVKVLQNGNVIYQENVPPGPFSFDHIQAGGAGGDLSVVVREADGREHAFRVAFSAAPNMLKHGVSEYQLLAGKVSENTTDSAPLFLQGSLRHGFNNLVTGYGGAILSENYQAYLAGSGWNLPFGAVSVDVTHAQTRLKQRREKGQSIRVVYSKFLDTTATGFTLAAYRYSTPGYYSFNEAIYANGGFRLPESEHQGEESHTIDMNTWDALRAAKPKNTLSVNLNQQLKEGWGSLFLSFSRRDYWTGNGNSHQYQLGYANRVGNVSYSVLASREFSKHQQEETRFYLSFNLPLNVFGHSSYLSTALSAESSRYHHSTVSLSGGALTSDRLSYSLNGSNSRDGGNAAGVSLGYRSRVATFGASHSEGGNYRQSSLSARGSLVLIPWHLLSTNEISRNMIVVEAPNARGLMVNNDESIITNAQGLALVPYATPYRQNSITLSDSADRSGAEIIGNIASNVPYRGAVSYLKFETDKRQPYLLRLTRPDGSPLPFGAEVLDENDNPIGFVGQASMLYLRADSPPAAVKVRLQSGSCQITKPSLSPDAPAGICR